MAWTPIKDKKPLPSSTSTVFPEQSNAPEHVKLCFLKGHWKDCVSRCHHMLCEAPNPPDGMRATYFHFYAAISHEAIARAMHDLSETKLMNLVKAKESYRAAATSLPVANESLVDWDDGEMFKTPSSPDEPWFQSPIKSRIAKYQSVSPSLASKFQFRPARASRDSMGLPSLHIHKNLQINSFPITPPRSKPTGSRRGDFDQSPPQTPPNKIRKSITPTSASRLSVTFSASSVKWLHQRSINRFNTHFEEFSSMLHRHIASVEHAISNTRDAQSNKHGKRLASFGASPEARAADLRARIVRLKADGWKRKRFAPERYQELCAKALSEL